MRLEVSHADVLLIQNILRDRSDAYKQQIVEGYRDESTPLDTVNDLVEQQKRVNRIIERLGEL